MQRFVFLLGAGCLACSRPAPKPAEAGGKAPLAAPHQAGSGFSVAASQTGSLSLSDGALRFLPCGSSGSGTRIADLPSGEGVAALHDLSPSGNAVTAMVRISNDSLREIRYIGPEGPSCGSLPPEGDLNAVGNEPFWHLRITGATAMLRTPEDTVGARFENGAWESGETGGWRFRAARSDGDTLTVTLLDERCSDGMSAARYSMKATIRRRAGQVVGCALEGRSAMMATP